MKQDLRPNQCLTNVRQRLLPLMVGFIMLCLGYADGLAQKCATPVPTAEEKKLLKSYILAIKQGSAIQKLPQMTTISIKAHVIGSNAGSNRIATSTITDAIAEMNKIYAQVNLKFKLVNNIHYINRTTWIGANVDTSVADSLELNNVNDALNIYFLQNLNYNGIGTLLGKSAFPSSNPLKNRMFMRNSAVSDKSTLTHEMGHYWSLKHTHPEQTDIERGILELVTRLDKPNGLKFGKNCDDDDIADGLCDTPAEPYSGSGCSYVGTKSDKNGQTYDPDEGNFMSYYDCPDHFSPQQYDQVEAGYGLRLRLSAGQYNFNLQASVLPPTDVKIEKVRCETTPIITWKDNASNEDGYLIERSYTNKAESFVAVGRVEPNVTTFTDLVPIAKTMNIVYYRIIAANANAKPSAVMPLLLMKPFIREVNVYNSKNELRYSAEWDKADEKGNTRVTVKKSNPIKPGEKIKIEVTTSEKLNGMIATLSKNIAYPSPNNNSSRSSFIFNITTSKTAFPEEMIEFNRNGTFGVDCRDNYLFGMKNGQFSANVGPDVTGKYPTNDGRDNFHKLQFCKVSGGLSMSFTVLDARTIRVNASGGTPPYKYQKDNEPETTNNVFKVTPNGTYNFAVIDDNGNGCRVEEIYTFISTDCNEVTTAGNQGVDIKRVGLGKNSGLVRVVYEMYSIPDEMTIQYKSAKVAGTNGLVSGSGTLSFNYTPTKNAPDFCIITVNAPNAGTAWTYTAYCPTNTTASRLAASQAIVPYSLVKEQNRVAILPNSATEKGTFDLSYRIVDNLKQGEWITLSGIELPYYLTVANKEVEVKVTPQNGRIGASITEEKVSLKVYPNPSNGPLTIEYFSETGGNALINIIDEAGRTHFERGLILKQGINLIETELNQKGIYFVSVQEEGKKSVTKVLVGEN